MQVERQNTFPNLREGDNSEWWQGFCKVSCVQRRIKQPSGVRGEGGGAGEQVCAKLYQLEQVCTKLHQLEQLCAKLYQLKQGDKGGTAGRYLRRVRSLFRPSRSPQTTPASAQTDENYRRTSSACRPPGKRGLVACCCSITSTIKIHPLQKISFHPALGMGSLSCVLKTLEQWCRIVNVCLHMFLGGKSHILKF